MKLLALLIPAICNGEISYILNHEARCFGNNTLCLEAFQVVSPKGVINYTFFW